jgi:hypothetical protein
MSVALENNNNNNNKNKVKTTTKTTLHTGMYIVFNATGDTTHRICE